MKKKMVSLMGLLLVAPVFAQSYPYADAQYQAVAKQVADVPAQRVEQFPAGFFIALRSNAMTQDDKNLYFELKNAYEKNPQDINATINYVRALLKPFDYDVDNEDNINLAYDLLKKAQRSNTKELEIYQLMENVLISKLQTRRSIEVEADYAQNPVLSQARLDNFEKRVALGDETLSSGDYEVASMLSRALGLSEKAAHYQQIAEELENETKIQETAIVRSLVLEEMSRSFKAKPFQSKPIATQDDLYGSMVENMSKGMK